MFSCLQKACLTINLPKYEFFATKLEFLSHVVNTSRIKPLSWPKYTAAIQDYPTPCSKEEISIFLRLLNFFRSFSPAAALLLQPLTNLMKKKALFVWGKEQRDSFDQAKEALLNSVGLQHLSPSAQVCLNMDIGTYIQVTLIGRKARISPGSLLRFTQEGSTLPNRSI